MAKTYHAGIIPGAEAKKLYSYPTLSASSDTFLMGSGSWADADNITIGTAKQAVRLQTPVNIDGYTFDGTQSMGRYIRCTTAGNQQIKQVTELTGFDNHAAGAWFILWLANDNTALDPQIQFGTQEPQELGDNAGKNFDTEQDALRLVQGAYLLVHVRATDAWMVISGPEGYYQTATQSKNGMMSKFDKQAHDTMVSALTNQCTTEIDASGCMVVKLFGSNIPFIKIDKAGEW